MGFEYRIGLIAKAVENVKSIIITFHMKHLWQAFVKFNLLSPAFFQPIIKTLYLELCRTIAKQEVIFPHFPDQVIGRLIFQLNII